MHVFKYQCLNTSVLMRFDVFDLMSVELTHGQQNLLDLLKLTKTYWNLLDFLNLLDLLNFWINCNYLTRSTQWTYRT